MSSPSPSSSPDQIRITKILTEIVDTESHYTSSLRILVEEFLRPLRENHDKFHLKLETISIIFSNVESLFGFHSLFLSALGKSPTPRGISNSIMKFADFLKLYVVYVNNYSDAMKCLIDLTHNKKFQNFQNEKRDKFHLDLPSFLIQPVQRIPRYELLIKELIRTLEKQQESDRNLEEEKSLEEALQKIVEIAKHVNDMKGKAERLSLLMSIQAKIQGVESHIPSLLSSHRRVVKEGEVYKKTTFSHSARYLYLFNDMFIWTEKGKYKGHFHQLEKTKVTTTNNHTEEEGSANHSNNIHNNSNNHNSSPLSSPLPFPSSPHQSEFFFSVEHPNAKSQTFYVENPHDQKLWMTAFHDAIEESKTIPTDDIIHGHNSHHFSSPHHSSHLPRRTSIGSLNLKQSDLSLNGNGNPHGEPQSPSQHSVSTKHQRQNSVNISQTPQSPATSTSHHLHSSASPVFSTQTPQHSSSLPTIIASPSSSDGQSLFPPTNGQSHNIASPSTLIPSIHHDENDNDDDNDEDEKESEKLRLEEESAEALRSEEKRMEKLTKQLENHTAISKELFPRNTKDNESETQKQNGPTPPIIPPRPNHNSHPSSTSAVHTNDNPHISTPSIDSAVPSRSSLSENHFVTPTIPSSSSSSRDTHELIPPDKIQKSLEAFHKRTNSKHLDQSQISINPHQTRSRTPSIAAANASVSVASTAVSSSPSPSPLPPPQLQNNVETKVQIPPPTVTVAATTTPATPSAIPFPSKSLTPLSPSTPVVSSAPSSVSSSTSNSLSSLLASNPTPTPAPTSSFDFDSYLAASRSTLSALSRNDITSLKKIKSPPQQVKMAIESVAILLGLSAQQGGDRGFTKVFDYWTPVQTLLVKPTFLRDLLEFNDSNAQLSHEVISTLRKYIHNPLLRPSAVHSGSRAAGILWGWVRAYWAKQTGEELPNEESKEKENGHSNDNGNGSEGTVVDEKKEVSDKTKVGTTTATSASASATPSPATSRPTSSSIATVKKPTTTSTSTSTVINATSSVSAPPLQRKPSKPVPSPTVSGAPSLPRQLSKPISLLSSRPTSAATPTHTAPTAASSPTKIPSTARVNKATRPTSSSSSNLESKVQVPPSPSSLISAPLSPQPKLSAKGVAAIKAGNSKVAKPTAVTAPIAHDKGDSKSKAKPTATTTTTSSANDVAKGKKSSPSQSPVSSVPTTPRGTATSRPTTANTAGASKGTKTLATATTIKKHAVGAAVAPPKPKDSKEEKKETKGESEKKEKK